MVASPEICRRNGAKSRGAVTKRGKAIASRNATKHGLLAKQPPLLVTEDLSAFETLIQGLIDYYQPQNPTEHFLIQQVAMGMVKQQRLWAVEAAIANLEILKARKARQFPDLVIPGKLSQLKAASDLMDREIPLVSLWRKERETLENLICYFDKDLEELPEVDPEDLEYWLEGVRESSGSAYFHDLRTAEVYKAQDLFDYWLDPWTYDRERHEQQGTLEPLPEVPQVVERIKKLQELARERMRWLDQQLEEIAHLDANIEQANVTAQTLQQPELFSRYQRSINRELYEALDRLEEMQQRKNGGLMGSFGQTPDLSVVPKDPLHPASRFPVPDSCAN